MGLLDKAQEVQKATAVKVNEMKEQAAQAAADFKDKASHAASEMKDKASHAASEMMDAGIGRLKEIVTDFNDALPMINKAGYSLGQVAIEIGIPPKIVATFNSSGAVDEGAMAELLSANEGKKLGSLLVKALFEARKLQDSISIGKLKPQGIAVEIGLLPTVTVKFG